MASTVPAGALDELDRLLDVLMQNEANAPDSELDRHAVWRGRSAPKRLCLQRLVMAEHEAAVSLRHALAATDVRPREVDLILGAAEIARGALLGLLVGVDCPLLDRRPAPNPSRTGSTPAAPTPRELLGQLVAAERADATAIREVSRNPGDAGAAACYSAARGQAATPLPYGPVTAIVDTMRRARAETVALLSELADADLDRPSICSDWAVDVRFRLHLLAARDRECAMQLAPTLAAVGHVRTETQALLGQLVEARGVVRAAVTGAPGAFARDGVVPGVAGVVERLQRHAAELREALASAPPLRQRAAS